MDNQRGPPGAASAPQNPLPLPRPPTETDPVIEPPNAPLIDAVAAALAASTDRVVILSHAGRRYVAKRVAPQPRSRLQAVAVRWLVKGITGQSLPMQTLRLADAATGVGFEARRLRALEQAGQRVPHLVHEGPDYLLLEHCGNTVANLLEDWTADTCRIEMENEARELGAFHRAGQWHGASQIKNLTRHDGAHLAHRLRGRLRRAGAAAGGPGARHHPVPELGLAGRVVDEAESRRLLPRLLALCLQENPDPRVRATLLRARPWVARLAWLSTPMRRRTVRGRQRKGALRLALLADALATLSDAALIGVRGAAACVSAGLRSGKTAP
jgi:hypothetical protein